MGLRNFILGCWVVAFASGCVSAKKYVSKGSHLRVRFCRENIYLRDDHTCQYCGGLFDRRELTLDHVLPSSKGGPKSWLNVVTSCRPCNQKKGNRTPQQARMPLLKPPNEPLWLPPKELQLSSPAPQVWAEYLLMVGSKSA